ncbi:apolipoprotein N-acyltransferase [Ancylomarina euxinus]|uniref:Apolipoprotein N-acyltransferase n=1 Tax=Ancylomarina euxinus TaxID=2283627 RepID=A0A425XY22_9BACT|nr:apolipoprotein N-acyltransferase [Ancylomarina euxinus]MCZ4695917.1 apolipoprotein N-acyltransferase [Ancylomarina euxinus]MUP16293.1 apolipoprotein N-acyltransferase [Ancylomarina euxinus]RRG19663.1 apolipoprotein N-acyltransferase [Ancylomarina euxinus]
MKYKTSLLALLSGILLAMPWTISVFFFTIFFAYIPLLILEEDSHKQDNPYWLFNYSFLAFLIWNSLSYWWVSEAQLVGSILIILINSAIQATVFWVISMTRKHLKISILFPFLIIGLGFEYFHTQWDLAWPWLNLGNAFTTQPKLVQWYEYTGVSGGSLWIIVTNIVLFTLFRKRNIRNLTGALLLFIIPIISSLYLYSQEEIPILSKSLSLIQPNLNPYTEKFQPENEKIHFMEFLSITDSLLQKDETDFVFGPETMILQAINEEIPIESDSYNGLVKLKSNHPRTEFLIGVHSYQKLGDKVPAGSRYNNKKDYYYEAFNSALFIAKNNKPKFYHKTKLVPLFERMPFVQYLSFLGKYSLELGGYNGTYSNRNTINTFTTSNSTEIIPIVCFESVFGDYCAQRVNQLPGFFCMITNDGWWKNSLGYKYHFDFSRLRAIENRREIVRVANNGISAIINSKGEIVKQTNWWTKDILRGDIKLFSRKTFYSTHGDYMGRTAAFFAILLLIFVKIKRITRANH